MQYELVRRRRNAVEIDKDEMRSLWSWLNFEHVIKKRSQDLIESGRIFTATIAYPLQPFHVSGRNENALKAQ